MNQKDISNSRTFKYLGTKISYDQPNAGDDEVNHRQLLSDVEAILKDEQLTKEEMGKHTTLVT